MLRRTSFSIFRPLLASGGLASANETLKIGVSAPKTGPLTAAPPPSTGQ